MGSKRVGLIVGAVSLVAGIIGLFMPVTISDGVACGSAVHSDVSAARAHIRALHETFLPVMDIATETAPVPKPV